MIHPDDFLNDDNYSILEEEIEQEITISKEKDRLQALWKQKCELRKEIQQKTQHVKSLTNQRNQVNEKMQNTLIECNTLNQTIEYVEKQKWKKIFEKLIYIVLDSIQLRNVNEIDNQITTSITTDDSERKSCILINNNQIEGLKQKIEELKQKSSTQIDKDKEREAINQANEFKRKAESYSDKFKEMMVLKLSTILPLNAIDSLFEESTEQDLSKLEKEIKDRENEVSKEINIRNKDLKTLNKIKLELMKDNTLLLKELNEKKEEYQVLISKIEKEKETSLNYKDEDAERKEEHDIEQLKELLGMQAKEIETLFTEINLFKRKGGHIYTTVTANKKNLEN